MYKEGKSQQVVVQEGTSLIPLPLDDQVLQQSRESQAKKITLGSDQEVHLTPLQR